MKTSIDRKRIQDLAKQFDCEPLVITAFCIVESGTQPWAVRYEPEWKYFLEVDRFAKINRITSETEKQLQACSWGLMQVMGSVARELGFEDSLPQLCIPEIGLEYGCKKWNQCLKRYPKIQDAISAYNGGSVRHVGGNYFNQPYVDRVTFVLRRLGEESKLGQH